MESSRSLTPARTVLAAALTLTLVTAGVLSAPASARADDAPRASVTASGLQLSSTFDGYGFDVELDYDAALDGACTTGWLKPVLYVADGGGFDAESVVVRSLGWREITAAGPQKLFVRVTEPGSYGVALQSPTVAADCLEGPAPISDVPAVASEITLTRTPTLNVALPTLTGTPKVGATLTAAPGTWQGAHLDLDYQWLRSGAAIDGATELTYLLGAADLGSTISVRVTATSPHDSASATSATTAIVDAGAIATYTPVITGTRAVGSTLGVTVPDGNTYAYQWYRGSTKIAGATGASYTLVTADGGTTIKVVTVASRVGYAPLSRTSAPTAAILKKLSAPAPGISGTVRVGTALKVVTGTWGPAPVTLKYQWSVDGTPVSGATAATFTPRTADLGKVVSVKVTGSKSAYASISKESAPTVPVALGAITLPAPTISGTAKVGSRLTAAVGTTKPTKSSLTLTYQWFSNGAAIAGATSSSYVPLNAQAGAKLTVRVTASNPFYTTRSATSAATAAIAAASAVTSKSGVLRVGVDIKPGTYYTAATTSCYWARLSDASGSLDSIISNDIGSGRRMVTIEAGDAYFEANRCGAWYRFDGTGKLASKAAGSGILAVGADIRPGTYRSDSASGCYVATLSGLSGSLSDIIANDYFSSAGIIYWSVSEGTYFESSRCGTWTRVSG